MKIPIISLNLPIHNVKINSWEKSLGSWPGDGDQVKSQWQQREGKWIKGNDREKSKNNDDVKDKVMDVKVKVQEGSMSKA